MDPCCGKGDAIKQLAIGLGCPLDRVYGIELSDTRSMAARETIPNVLGPADFHGCAITAQSFGFAWVNPPFDSEIGGGERVEYQFLVRATRMLVTGGVMALVCPERIVEDRDVKQCLLHWYHDIAMIPFPEPRKFKEVIVFGVKRASSKKDIPYWWEWEPNDSPPVYEIPGSPKPRRFEKIAFTSNELGYKLERSPLRSHLEPPGELPKPRPPLPVNTGQTGLMVASGQLDGIVRAAGELPHVVRGTAVKSTYVSNVEERENADDSTTTITTLSERIIPTVRAVDATGEIKTFGGG
jgi:hypothetical protein